MISFWSRIFSPYGLENAAHRVSDREAIRIYAMERVMGLEPTTSSLARKRSTAELHPHQNFYTINQNRNKWRPEWDSNPRIWVLQTHALPLGYQASSRLLTAK